MNDPERKTVKHISKMDNETFLKHMNARHKGAAGITHFGKSNVPGDGDEHLLRMMHDTLHDERYAHLYGKRINHDHGKASE